MRTSKILAAAFFMPLFFSCSQKQSTDEHSPESSLADLKVYPELEINLFASEPVFSKMMVPDIKV